MRTSVSLLLGILISGSCWSHAHGNPVYSVTGVALELELILIAKLTRNIVVVLVRFSMVLLFA